jgi:hypothetical protein
LGYNNRDREGTAIWRYEYKLLLGRRTSVPSYNPDRMPEVQMEDLIIDRTCKRSIQDCIIKYDYLVVIQKFWQVMGISDCSLLGCDTM